MAVDRKRIAAALAYEEEKRRMMESVPRPGQVQAAPPSRNFRRDLENLSIGIGEGLTSQLEGIKGIVTDPLGAARGAYETVKGVVRDPAVIADALRYTAQKAGSGPLGAGEVISEMVSPMRGRAPTMARITKEVDYRGQHKAPTLEAASADDLTKNGIYPNDVYRRPDWYESGDGLREMWKIQQYRGNPDAPVTIYRAIPKDVPRAVNQGDWVTTSRKYAKQHGESALNGDYKIVSKKVRAKDIFTKGDSILEWGYNPSND